MKVQFLTIRFFSAHGKQPRGNGCWWFEANGKQYSVFGSYSAAKEQCKELIEQDNPNETNVVVYVLP